MSGRLARRLAALCALVILGLTTPLQARRLPAPGGEASLALPTDLREATIAAHTRLPLTEPVPTGSSAADRLAHPTLAGVPWRSWVLSALTDEENGSRWRLTPRTSGLPLEATLRDCLSAGRGSWPGDALSAGSVDVRIEADGDDLLLSFDAPFGPVPELLAGCSLVDPMGAAFVLEGNRLEASAEAVGGPPMLTAVELKGPLAPADLAGGTPQRGGGGTLVTEAPDVVLLVLSEPARSADPLGLQEGLARLRHLLDPELLLAVFWEGRGGPTDGLLPPGIAPSRPLPPPGSGLPELALRLDSLPDDAPRLDVSFDPMDPLAAGVVERLAVVLRSRGWALGGSEEHAEVVRWRPPTLDPALAVLALAGTRPALIEGGLLTDPALLGLDPDERLAAAMAVERAWIQERRVVPLMTADRWIVVDPDLRGVRLRPDGVPLLHDAWWAASP